MIKVIITLGVIVIFFVGAFLFTKNPVEAPQNGEELAAGQAEQKGGPQPPTSVEVSSIQGIDKIFATISTAKGDIKLELYPKIAPTTVANFRNLANADFYDGTKFHRVISDFMIQGGDPLSKTDDPRVGTGGPGYQFQDEINSLKVDVGAIAMANSGPNTNGSQFFIVTERAQPHLDGKHTVFGKVVAGIEIVRSIKQGDVINDLTVE